MLKIGKLKLSSPFILAPLSGVSNLPFRMINRDYGCELAFCEMISARALVYNKVKTKQMIVSSSGDRPLGVQLLADDAEIIKRALDILRPCKFDLIDLNAGCPAPKVAKKGQGAGLLTEPAKLKSLLKALAGNSPSPATVKIRAGWCDKSVNAREIALICQEAGAKAIFVHGRTRSQGYRGQVNYQVIREVKEAVDIPVIGSGDIFDALSAKKMFEETGCDALLAARGSLGNPWIFKEIEEYLKHGRVREKPALEEVVAVMKKHLKLCVEFFGERIGVVIFRKYFIWYTKGFHHIRHLRREAFATEDKEGMLRVIEKVLS